RARLAAGRLEPEVDEPPHHLRHRVAERQARQSVMAEHVPVEGMAVAVPPGARRAVVAAVHDHRPAIAGPAPVVAVERVPADAPARRMAMARRAPAVAVPVPVPVVVRGVAGVVPENAAPLVAMLPFAAMAILPILALVPVALFVPLAPVVLRRVAPFAVSTGRMPVASLGAVALLVAVAAVV